MKVKKILLTVVLMVLSVFTVSVTSNAESEVIHYGGVLGKNSLKWEIYSDGSLVIKPYGERSELIYEPGSSDTKGVLYMSLGDYVSRDREEHSMDELAALVTKIRFEGQVFAKGKSCMRMFTGFPNLEKIYMNHLFIRQDNDGVCDVQGMFNTGDSVTSIEDLKHDTFEEVTNAGYLFKGLSSKIESLTSVKVIFDMPNVKYTYGMFEDCSNLKILPAINNSDSEDGIHNAANMFKGTTVEEIDISKMKFTGTGCSYLFAGSGIEKFTWDENIDTSSVTNFDGMFADCKNLYNLNLDYLDTTGATTMRSVFEGCTDLKDIRFGEKFVVDCMDDDASDDFYGEGTFHLPNIIRRGGKEMFLPTNTYLGENPGYKECGGGDGRVYIPKTSKIALDGLYSPFVTSLDLHIKGENVKETKAGKITFSSSSPTGEVEFGYELPEYTYNGSSRAVYTIPEYNGNYFSVSESIEDGSLQLSLLNYPSGFTKSRVEEGVTIFVESSEESGSSEDGPDESTEVEKTTEEVTEEVRTTESEKSTEEVTEEVKSTEGEKSTEELTEEVKTTEEVTEEVRTTERVVVINITESEKATERAVETIKTTEKATEVQVPTEKTGIVQDGRVTEAEKTTEKDTKAVTVPVEVTTPSLSAPKILKVSNTKGLKVKVSIKKVSGVKYKYQISTSKKYKFILKTIDSKKSSVVFKKLKKGTTYYVRVCAYMTKDGNTTTGGWSKVKKIKVKK